MACKNICKLCRNLVISQSVTFTGGNVVVNIPAGSYFDNCKYCIVIAQSIPVTTAPASSPVVITVGTGTELYPLLKCDCAPATVCDIHTRTKYSVCVNTNSTGGTFRMIGKNNCNCQLDGLQSINGTAPATPAVATASVETSAKGVK